MGEPSDREKASVIYTETHARHGQGVEALRYSIEGHTRRHRVVVSWLQDLLYYAMMDELAILDVGCGHGDLYARACMALGNRLSRYDGIDLVPQNIKIAQSRFPSISPHFQVESMKDVYRPGQYDVAVFIDSLTEFLDLSALAGVLAHFWRQVRVGLVFTLNSTTAEVATDPFARIFDPKDVLPICLELSRCVRVVGDFMNGYSYAYMVLKPEVFHPAHQKQRSAL